MIFGVNVLSITSKSICLSQSKLSVLRGIFFTAVTFEVSFQSVITLLPVSVIYHPKAYVMNFQNSHIILI